MTVKEIEEILSSTSSSDWVIEEELGAYTYKQDVLLRIQKHPIDYHADKFSGEEWATTMHADSEAYRVVYDVFYGESFIETKQLVAVDEIRNFAAGGDEIAPAQKRAVAALERHKVRAEEGVEVAHRDHQRGHEGHQLHQFLIL